jgi:hypothetical protein
MTNNPIKPSNVCYKIPKPAIKNAIKPNTLQDQIIFIRKGNTKISSKVKSTCSITSVDI